MSLAGVAAMMRPVVGENRTSLESFALASTLSNMEGLIGVSGFGALGVGGVRKGAGEFEA